MDKNFKLKITLKDLEYYAEYEELLKKYASVEKNFSREILVNANTTLHQLHYIINQAFGFTNSHLHAFRLLDRDYRALTYNKIDNYLKYLGIYFHYVDYLDDDATYALCFDDDYNDSENPFEWMRSKYNSNTPYLGLFEQYPHSQFLARERFDLNEILHVSDNVLSKNKKLKMMKDCTLEEYENYRYASLNELNERLTLDQILYLDKGQYDVDYDSIYSEAKNIYEKFKYSDYKTKCRKYLDKIKVDSKYLEYASQFDYKVKPLSNKITYEYDFGCAHKFDIQVIGAYYVSSDIVIDSLTGNRIENNSTLYKQNIDAINYNVQCLNVDGCNLIDDFSLPSFITMLETLDKMNKDPEDDDINDEDYYYARSCGFNGKKPNKKKMF